MRAKSKKTNKKTESKSNDINLENIKFRKAYMLIQKLEIILN